MGEKVLGWSSDLVTSEKGWGMKDGEGQSGEREVGL